MDELKLRLYICGKTPRSERAIANLRAMCGPTSRSLIELEIIDVLEHPQLAEEEKILTTPTLIRCLPPPFRRIIGDLSDTEKVLIGLDLTPLGERPTDKEDQ
jgi:circadian clock protein KaiB